MPTMRQSSPCAARSFGCCSWSREANRRPTLPKPTSARSARGIQGGGDRVEHLADVLEGSGQRQRVAAEADAQVPVHAEVIAGHDEHAAFVTQPLGKRRRSDLM